MGEEMDGVGGLTEITLSSDVFPAFCKPIMVTSISVALLFASDM